ncbi:MAG: hypothetical protein NC489_08790 [Ruminococcus flavefaciens]|nr:hypothetical protein [Ruminococcus flavefaciens]
MSLRKEIEADIYGLLDDMDPSGKNTTRMKNFLNQMDDKEFYKFMDEFFSNPDKNIPVAYEAYNNPVTLDFIHEIARKHDVPIYEYVYRPYLNGDKENPPGTIHKIMVLDVPVKRLKQMAQSKNHVSTASAKRDPKTGQVSGDDKTARVTDVEGYSLLAQGQYSAAQEYFGPMADDSAAHYEMLRRIQRDGEVELKDLPNDPLDKVTLNTINALLLGACIQTNLIDQSGLMLPITLKAKEGDATTIDRG